MARKRANLTDLLNNLTFRTLFDRYKLIAMNEWEWCNLPDGIEPRHIERLLFSRGFACFFRAPGMGFMCLECDPGQGVNVYGDPQNYRVHGHGYQRNVNADDCVVVKNNLLCLPTETFVMHYVNKLTEAERTMDVNVKACKTPVIFACDDKDVLTFKQIFHLVDGNTPAIFADRGLNLDAVQAFQTGVKFMGNELMDYKRAVESDLLTFLGQNNTPVDKKERLITSEAEANDQLIAGFADLQREARETACKEINALFGLNITVKRRAPVVKPVKTVDGGGADVRP